jgi:hypothetical protein
MLFFFRRPCGVAYVWLLSLEVHRNFEALNVIFKPVRPRLAAIGVSFCASASFMSALWDQRLCFVFGYLLHSYIHNHP